MLVDVFPRRGRWVCGTFVGATPFARCNFGFGRLMFVLDDSFLTFEGVIVFANTKDRAVGTCGLCPVDRYCMRIVVLVDGRRMMLKASNVI